MKKLFCLVLALMLVFSIFGTVVAFAEEDSEEENTTVRELTFNEEAFVALSQIQDTGRLHKLEKFMLDNSWLKNVETVKSVFGDNIVYELKEWADDAENKDELAVTTDSDRFSVEYCSPSSDYKQSWSSTGTLTETTTINISSIGWWAFRYVVKDKNDTILARTSRIDIYFGDEDAPVMPAAWPSDMLTKQDDGIKVGETYTIKTSISTITDTSSKTISYVVYKWVNGAWTEEPIYDSTTKELAEGYEGFNASTGTITMLESDVLPDDQPVYKIVYQAVDTLGYVSETKDFFLKATAAEKEEMSAADIWKIVLYVVAGLSAVGIVVVLCIKPKEESSEIK